jgi:uncharacterized protein (UPF0147 family)
MTYSEKTTTKRITKQEKELLQNKTNQESLAAAIGTLENISANYCRGNRTSKSRVHELLLLLKHHDSKVGLSIRAANAISILDSMSQDKRIESHIRTMLWQVVSNLEGIRE